MSTCDTCRFWQSGRFGKHCDLATISYDDPSKPPAVDQFEVLVTASDDTGLEGVLLTGPKFGCVLHEPLDPG